jgi:hypothetical protein
MSRYGTVLGGTANARCFVAQGADADSLFVAAATAFAAATAIVPPLVDPIITSLTLTGAGDGHMFFLELEFAAAANVDGGADVTGVQFLLSSTAEDLQKQIAALQNASPILDTQIAGAAKGQRVMALVLFGTVRVSGCAPVLLQYNLLESPDIAPLTVESVLILTDSIPATATAVDAWLADPVALQPRMALVGVQYTPGAPSSLQLQIQNLDPVLHLQTGPCVVVVAYYTCPLIPGNIVPPP